MSPTTPMVTTSEGVFYGVTQGDINGPYSRVYRYIPGESVEALGVVSGGPTKTRPVGELTKDASGRLWGLTTDGSFSFAHWIDSGGRLSSIIRLGMGEAVGRLCLGSDDFLYYYTKSTSAPGVTQAHRFANPHASTTAPIVSSVSLLDSAYTEQVLLLVTTAGKLVGSARDGANSRYVLFTRGADGSVTTAPLPGEVGSPGTLLEATSGVIYGLSATGGSAGFGAFFRLSPGASSAELLASFDRASGIQPAGSLALGADGKYYGTTLGDDQTAAGAFRVSTDGALERLGPMPAGSGCGPAGLATLDGTTFYGPTRLGGTFALGQIAQVTASGEIAATADFQAYGDGVIGPVAETEDGSLYGVTQGSGPMFSFGEIFQVKPTGEVVPRGFLDGVVGGSVRGGVALGPDGALYAAGWLGGTANLGSIMRLSFDGRITQLASFHGNDGQHPTLPLCWWPAGQCFIGATEEGGSASHGVIFKVTTAGAYSAIDLTSATGYALGGAFAIGADGVPYAATKSGGANGYGTIVRLNAAGNVEVVRNLASTDPRSAIGAMALGRDGLLYGACETYAAYRLHSDGTLDSLSGIDLASASGFVAGSDGRIYTLFTDGWSALFRFLPGPNPYSVYSVDIPKKTASKTGTLACTRAGVLYSFEPSGDVCRLPVPPNNPPEPGFDVVSARKGTMVLNPGSNDYDRDGDPLTLVSVGTAAHGDVAITGPWEITYTPHSDFAGDDSFEYTVTDAFGESATASVYIQNSDPVAEPDNAFLPRNHAAVTVDVLANDYDYDPDQSLTLASVSAPAAGAAVIVDGKVQYTPGRKFTGSDSFTYTVQDDFGATATGTVRVADVRQAGAGSYTGAIYDQYGSFLGLAQLTLARTGMVSGRVMVDTVQDRVLGMIESDGTLSVRLQGAQGRYTALFQFNPQEGTVTASWTDEDEQTYTLRAARPPYSVRHPAPAAGRYTFTMEQVEDPTSEDSDSFGAGYGTITVSATGAARMTGIFADRHPFSASGAVLDAETVGFDAPVPYAGYRAAAFHGSFKLGSDPAGTGSGFFEWLRYFTRPNVPPTEETRSYDATGTLAVSRFTPSKPMLSLAPGDDNLVLALSYDGNPYFSPTLSWKGNNRIAGPYGTVTINPRTGLFTGVFVDPTSDKRTPFGGAVLQLENRGAGVFLKGGRIGTVQVGAKE